MLLDQLLPTYDVVKRHALAVPAGPARVFSAAEAYDLRDSRVTRLLMRLRGYGPRMRPSGARGPLSETLIRFGFVSLGKIPGREMAFGLVGKFWRKDGGLLALGAEEFVRFEEPGYAKAIWNILVEERDTGRSLLSTETRVLCLGQEARRPFLRYWRWIEPFSGLIRISLLRGVRRKALEEGGISR